MFRHNDPVCLPSVPVFYASTHGQAARVAMRVVSILRDLGWKSDPIDLESHRSKSLDWSGVQGAVLGASLHAGKHQKVARRFAHRHATELSHVPSLFFSVSLGAHSKEPKERQQVEEIARQFVTDAGWVGVDVVLVAGRLAYTQYSWFIRWIMKRIARANGASTDTSRDHEFTDWTAVATFAQRFSNRLYGQAESDSTHPESGSYVGPVPRNRETGKLATGA